MIYSSMALQMRRQYHPFEKQKLCANDDKSTLQHRIEVLKRMSADDLLSKVTSLQEIINDIKNGKVCVRVRMSQVYITFVLGFGVSKLF